MQRGARIVCRCLLPVLLLIAFVSAWPAHAQTVGADDTRPVPVPLARLYVFGDSYSDTGAGYVDGNGPTAAHYFAARLGLGLVHWGAPATDPDDSVNFAVSGARSGREPGVRIKSFLLGRDLQAQVGDFRSALAEGKLAFEPGSTLAFIAVGLNDRIPVRETADNLATAVASLHDAGIRRIRIALLPVGTPAFSVHTARLNPAIRKVVGVMRATYRDADIGLSHWGFYFDEVRKNGPRYGLTETDRPCSPGRALFDQEVRPCPDPDRYFFYHPDHPSTAAHRAVGDLLWAEWQRESCRSRPGHSRIRPDHLP